MDPSPTAEATRFTEPCRMSPVAKTPGMLVSSNSGARSADHLLWELPSRSRSREYVASLVAFDFLGQPAGVGLGVYEDEQGGRPDDLCCPRGRILDGEVL